jgi:hypothetical protein
MKKLISLILVGVFMITIFGCKMEPDSDDENGGGTTVERVIEEIYRGWYHTNPNEVSNTKDWLLLTENKVSIYENVPSSIIYPPIDSKYFVKSELYYTKGTSLRPYDTSKEESSTGRFGDGSLVIFEKFYANSNGTPPPKSY